MTATRTANLDAQVSAAVDALINAQDCFRQSQKYPMYSETRKSWVERANEYNKDFMTFRPKVRKEAYSRFDTARKWIIENARQEFLATTDPDDPATQRDYDEAFPDRSRRTASEY